jgi:hypothetical protein
MLQIVGVEVMSKSRMGNMKLNDFSTSPPSQVDPESMISTAPAQVATPAPTAAPAQTQLPASIPPSLKEKVVTMNIKIPADLHEWLTETARAIRDNNAEAVPAGERVFPQHLIVAALKHLQSSDVDWQQIKTVQDLNQNG